MTIRDFGAAPPVLVRSPYLAEMSGDRVDLSGPGEVAEPEDKHVPPTMAGIAGAVMVGAVMATLASTAAAAEPPPATISLPLNGSPEDVARARSYGLSESGIQRLAADPETAAVARTIPSDVARLYSSYNARQRKVMHEQLNGHTRYVVVKIDNRKAFIDGEAMGVDAFPFMRDRIDEQVKKKAINAEEGEELKAGLDRMRSLTPQQRAAIARIIDMDQSPATPPPAASRT